MYVEISAVGSGKTTRMLAAVKNHLVAGEKNVAVIVAPRIREARMLQALFYGEYTPRLIIADTMKNLFHPSADMSKVKFFVHDFDFIDEDRLVILEDAYYVTGIKRIRTAFEKDFLTELVDAVGGKYHSYSYLGDHQQCLETFGEREYSRIINRRWRSRKICPRMTQAKLREKRRAKNSTVSKLEI